jgi:hypothetical protein
MKVLFLCLFSLFLITTTNGLYSIKFFSSVDQTLQFSITVNGVSTSYAKAVTSPSSGWIDFAAAPGDTLSVKMDSLPSDLFSISYLIKSGPRGSGLLVYDSKINVYTPVNACTQETCTGSITTYSFTDSSLNLYINNTEVLNDFKGTSTFPITLDDSIRIQFNYGGQDLQPFYKIITSGAIGSFWFYDAYGSNAQIANPLLSPFGGRLSPITQLQSQLFAESFGPSTIWVPIRGPPF